MREFFGVNDSFVRPRPTDGWAPDIGVAATLAVVSLVTLPLINPSEELVRLYPHAAVDASMWWSVAAIVAGGVLLVFRRRYPLAVMWLLTGAHFLVAGEVLPWVIALVGMQISYFVGIYSAMAWGRNRVHTMWSVIALIAFMTIWASTVYKRQVDNIPDLPVFSVFLMSVVVNVAYFIGAVWLGRNAWVQAGQEEALRSTYAVIEDQRRQLTEQAAVSERVRIARELHDSVAHSVALIGVQAAAARRVLDKRPDDAKEAMAAVELGARQTIDELRHLVGSLRSEDGESAQLSIAALPELCEQFEALGLHVTCEVVGDPDQLSAPQEATVFRVAQEALSNVRRHSTARTAGVAVRIQPASVELEVVDDGNPIPEAAGSGLGHVGMRERVAALGGSIEIGPRPTRGFRVRAVLPIAEAA